ncbi:MAG: 2-C-methyl-D-erythritol 4-phosphate cytidylyltransferase, partial [Thermoguttaceae bacterium]|nr:2-C-methyl-D-erythritol 4-phosphate cytidylyltransferase [Thermoguttaceae bacterium]
QAAEKYGSSEVTDDAALFERAGLPVALVESDHKNPKITTAWDLAIAGMILG